jgi:hypothetical protein
LRHFRHNREPEHTAVAQWLAGADTIQAVERAAFGLPLPFQYKQGEKFRRGPTAVVEPQSQDYERRASPLWLKVAQTGDGSCYFGIATLFKSELLPGDMQLTATAEQDAAPAFAVPSASYGLIEDFIQGGFAQKQFAATEVHYA